MKRKSFKKYLSSLLILTFVFLTMSAPAYALEITSLENQRERMLFQAQISATSDTPLAISNIKTAYDFSGSKYTIVECSPIGYYIYHNESGNFVEYSPESLSPFKDVIGELYYGGPMEYYTKDGNIYTHTLETSLSFDETVAEDLIEPCKKIVENRKVKQNVLNFVQKTPLSRSAYLDEQTASAIVEEISPRATIAWASEKQYLENISQMPSNTEGTCGYVACAILLWYWQMRGKNMKIPGAWYTRAGLPNQYLHDKLRSYGSCGTAWGAKDRIVDYCNDYGVGATVRWYVTGIGIESEIQAGRPVILFGNLWSNSHNSYVNHAVILYGWTPSACYANFGWPGYNKVVVEGTYGSNAQFIPN